MKIRATGVALFEKYNTTEETSTTNDGFISELKSFIDSFMDDEKYRAFSSTFIQGLYNKFQGLIAKNQEQACKFVGGTEGHPDFASNVLPRKNLNVKSNDTTTVYAAVNYFRYGTISLFVFDVFDMIFKYGIDLISIVDREEWLAKLNRRLEMVAFHETVHACIFYRLHSNFQKVHGENKTTHEWLNYVYFANHLNITPNHYKGMHEGFAQYATYLKSYPSQVARDFRFPEDEFRDFEAMMPEFYMDYRDYIQAVSYHYGHEEMIRRLFENFEVPSVVKSSGSSIVPNDSKYLMNNETLQYPKVLLSIPFSWFLESMNLN